MILGRCILPQAEPVAILLLESALTLVHSDVVAEVQAQLPTTFVVSVPAFVTTMAVIFVAAPPLFAALDDPQTCKMSTVPWIVPDPSAEQPVLAAPKGRLAACIDLPVHHCSGKNVAIGKWWSMQT